MNDAASAQTNDASPSKRCLAAVLLLAALGAAAYANSLANPFLFDDLESIVKNDQLRDFQIVRQAPTHPRALGLLSFALNYACGGLNVWGYHAVNLAIHLAAAVTLFGIVRRTLLSPRLRDRFGAASTGLALTVAALWLVHPLQTESVTYVVQRFESLMGLFYLLTLYCFLRGAGGDGKQWYFASVACCVLALRAKEVAITAPLLVLWYDGVFYCQNFRQLLTRKTYYGALTLVTVLLSGNLLLNVAGSLAPQLASSPTSAGAPSEPEDFSAVVRVRGVTPLGYLATQPAVILHYLRLCFWPADLCFDYRWPVAQSIHEWLPAALVIVAMLALTVWLARRRPAIGFLAGAFFLILAPTSSIVPIQDLAVEHRMYLPLAAVISLTVLGVHAWLWKPKSRAKTPISSQPRVNIGVGLASLAVVVLGVLTMLRNRDYASSAIMWADVVAKRPLNPRGYTALGRALVEQGEIDDAARCYLRAIEVEPAWFEAYYNLANLLSRSGRPADAVPYYRHALDIDPRDPKTHNNLAAALFRLGRTSEAAAHYRLSLRYRADVTVCQNLAKCLELQGKPAEAIDIYRQALAIEPRGTPRFADLEAAMKRLQTAASAASS